MADSLPARSRLFGWLGWAGLDAIGRLALLTGSTVILSRMLTPRDFGITALVLAIVAAVSLFVGAPFEDALAQKKHLRRMHLRAALGFSWAVAGVVLAMTILIAAPLARLYGEPDVAVLLPVATLSIIFSSHSDIMTALARRLRRFNDVAMATLAGHAIGIALALALAFAGYGLWALVGQRVLVVIARAALLQWRLGYIVLPAWSWQHMRGLLRFSGISFLSRLTENLAYLGFNNAVQVFYGTALLGQVNMALRLVEPIRGAIVATGHNIAFPFLARAVRDPNGFATLASGIIGNAAFAIAPVFCGLAAVAAVLLPLMAGPGWDDAVTLTVFLSAAGALGVPAGLVFTTLSASGRPEYNLAALVAGLATMLAVLILLRHSGPLSIGLSRLASDAIRAVVAIAVMPQGFSWPRARRWASLWPAWLLAAIMGMAVLAVDRLLAGLAPVARLSMLIGAGITIYGVLLAIFARPFLRDMRERLGARKP